MGSADSDVPVPVSTSTGLSNVTVISGAPGFGLALCGTDGTVWTWGADSDGQLGHNTFNVATDTPLKVQAGDGDLTGVIAIAGGGNNGLALRNDGTVWAWGYDGNDELGDETPSDSPVAVQVPGLSGITAISVGYFFCAALKSDGTVWAWGTNADGELGNGTTVDNTASPSYTGPVQVSSLAGIVAISCAGDHALALKSDGSVYAWGGNSSSFALGNGTSDGQSNVPVRVPGLSGIVALAAGRFQNTVLGSDGTVWGWGNDDLFSYVPIVVGNRSSALPPTISPAGGAFASDQSISITSSVAGTIHYTLDGTEPTVSSVGGSETITLTLGESALVSAAVFNSDGVMVTPIVSSQFYINDSGDTGLPIEATGLSVIQGSTGDLQLSWTLSGTVNYSEIGIYRSTNGGDYELIGVVDPGTSTFDDTNVQATNSYQYKIGTFNDSGESDTSATGSASPTSTDGLIINVTTPSGATAL